MRITLSMLLPILLIFFNACNNSSDNIISQTNGVINTDQKPQITFKSSIKDDKANIVWSNNDEISLNNTPFDGNFIFSNKGDETTLTILPNTPLEANMNYKIKLNADNLNKLLDSQLISSNHTIEFSTEALLWELSNHSFKRDAQQLDKMRLSFLIELSQEIPSNLIQDNIKILSPKQDKIAFTSMQINSKTFQINSEPFDAPKNSGEFEIVADKKLGFKDKQTFKIPFAIDKTLQITNIAVKQDNSTIIEVKFSHPLAKNLNIDNFIKISPKVKFSVSQIDDTLIIKSNLAQDQNYILTILNGLKSTENLTLQEDYSRELRGQDIAPKIIFSNNGVFLPDTNNKKIAFRSINVKRAHVIVKKIYENNISYFLLQKDLQKSSSSNDYIYDFNLLGDIVYEQDININYTKNIWNQNEINLSALKDTSGIFIISLQFDEKDVDYTFPNGTADWKRRNYFYDNGVANKQIIFSNIGLLAQKAGNAFEVSVIDITKNKPLSGVDIQSISTNNQIIDSAKSDNNGNAVLKYSKETPNLDTFYIKATTKNGDLGLIKLSSQELSDDGFDTSGITNKGGIKSYIYTDRGVYRPGESINLTIIARNQTTPIKHPIKLSIIDPKGKKILSNHSVKSFDNGMFYYEFKTNKTSPTGIYEASIDIGGNIFLHKIMVETIVPNRIKAEIKAQDKINLQKQHKFEVALEANYLFGAPASNLEYIIDASFTPKQFVSKKYKDWVFDNPSNFKYHNNKNYNGKLNQNGVIERTIELSKIDEINKNLEANIIARVFENNGRQVNARKKIVLQKYDSVVGIKPPSSRYIQQGTISIPVVLLDENEQFIKGRRLSYTIYNNKYSWWIDYDNYEHFLRSIKSDKNTTIIANGEITSKDDITNILFDVNTSGEILVEVKDTTNNQSASITLHSSSWGEGVSEEKITQLKIKSNKQEYTHNEEAIVTFESTRDSKALIVVSNNDKILERYLIDANERQTSIKVKINESYAPNVYVSVFLLQDYSKSNNDRAIRLYGIIPLKIINKHAKINLELEAPQKILPNSNLKVSLSNKERKQVTYTLAIVDEGLLDITKFKSPSPYDYFFAKTKLGIQNYDNYGYIIDKISGSINQTFSVGGDEELQENRYANKQKDNNAERFKNVVFFVKPTKSDENGNAVIDFKVPSYMGSLRVMAVAVDDTSFGSVSKNIEVSAPVVMLPTIPRSLKVGDTFNMPIEVLKVDSNANSAELSVQSNGIIMFDKTKQKVDLLNTNSQTIFFKGKVSDELGVETIKITLKSRDFTMEDSTQIDVKAPNPYIQISNNYILESNKTLEIKAPTQFIKNSNRGNITISASPLLNIDHRLLWLMRYPYGCIEQTTSSVFPQLFISKLSNADFIDKQTIIENINAGISRISSFQTTDGGLAYWSGGHSSNLWGSAYAMHFLIMAKKQGYYVNEELSQKLQNYLVNNAEDVYILYVLALGDKIQLGLMNEIYENRLNSLSTTSKWLLGASYKIAGFDDIAKKITANLPTIPNESNAYYDYSYGTSLRNEAMILQAYKIIYGKIDEKLYNKIQKTLQSDEWLSTQTIAYTLLALADIKEDFANKKIEGSININGKKSDFNKNEKTLNFTLNSGTASLTSKDNLFVNYIWEGVVADNSTDNLQNNIKLTREFVNFDNYGNEYIVDVKNLKSAQSFYIKLTLSMLNEQYQNIRNIALTQNLPSGWEIENTRINNDNEPSRVINANKNITYTDILDDKIMWFFDLYSYNSQVVYVKINTTTPGNYTLPAAYAEAMYDGRYNASTDSFKVNVIAK